MSRIGDGYGSECHLLRYLGRHRERLDNQLCSTFDWDAVRWLDFPFDAKQTWKDGEWKGLEFLPMEDSARQAWLDAWPQRGNPPNWDAVAQASVGGSKEWLLVEAKAHIGELTSSCSAKEGPARAKIENALNATKKRLGVADGHDWLNGYYQFCNRLAVLNILQGSGTPARLLFIYFIGDEFPESNYICPVSEAEWRPALEAQARAVGLPDRHPLADRVHKVCLPVCPVGGTGD